MPDLTIGKLARATEVKIPTIRFYEQIGLLPEPTRSETARRLYDQTTVRRLTFIKHARQLGFSVDAVRSLLMLADDPERPCNDANAIAAEQLADIEAKLSRLEALRDELQHMLSANCEGGRTGDCRVIEVLGDHALCRTDH